MCNIGLTIIGADARNRIPVLVRTLVSPPNKQWRGDVVVLRDSTTINATHHNKGMVMDLEEIIGFDALYKSMAKCKNGVLWKDSVAHFCHNAPVEIAKLSRELKNGEYKPRLTKKFLVLSPKRREVMGVAFRDRVYQRSLNDNAIYPQMTKHFIYDNAACQKGKGADFARNRLRCHLQRFYRKYGLDGYVLQCDIKGYYPNMPHKTVDNEFKAHLEPEIYKLASQVLTGQYSGDTGYYPGSQMIQIAGIAVLNNLDHFIKERLRIRQYLRYMDDFILIHHDEEYLEECKREIKEELRKIGLELHPEKTRIYKVSEPIKFLGFYHRLTASGKIISLIDPKNVKNEKKKLRRMVNKALRGEIPRAKVDECFIAWKAHALHGNNKKMVNRMEKYYRGLWETGQNNLP